MQIVCPNCSTSYDVQAAVLGATGRSVRCVRCRMVWFAAPVAEAVLAEVPVEPMASIPDDPVSAPVQQIADDAAAAPEYDWSFSPDVVTEDGEGSSAAAPEGSAAEAAPEGGLGQDAVDAMFSTAGEEPVVETEAESPSIVPAVDPEAMPDTPVQDHHIEPENIEAIAARRARPPKKRRKWTVKLPRPGMPAMIVALAAMLAGLAFGRVEVVRFVPQTASLFSAVGLPVNLRGLVFEHVRTTGEVQEGVPVLIVEGSIANVSNKTVEVPRLRFALRSSAGHEVYAWTTVTGRSILAPGETAAFRTRLTSPPAEGRDVIVRFFHRRDLLAGMR